MSKIKQSLMRQIEDKIKKKRDYNNNLIDPKDYRVAVFDFFKNLENIIIDGKYDPVLLALAKRSLSERLSIIDSKCRAEVHHNEHVRGVTITWSINYAKQNNIEPTVYVDVADMLLL